MGFAELAKKSPTPVSNSDLALKRSEEFGSAAKGLVHAMRDIGSQDQLPDLVDPRGNDDQHDLGPGNRRGGLQSGRLGGQHRAAITLQPGLLPVQNRVEQRVG